MIFTEADITKNLTLTCDVCVVGSGAGGAVVAKELAESGLDVILLEEGSPPQTKDFASMSSVGAMNKLYREAGTTVVYGKPNILYLEGRCLGGSTTVNGGMCWRTPEKILKRWQWERNLPDLSPARMDAYFTRVEKEIHAESILPESMNHDAELIKRGADKLGYEIKTNVRSHDLCVGTNQCLTGCPTGGKQSTLVSYVPKFLSRGGRVYCNTRARKVRTRGRQVIGVDAVVLDPVTDAPLKTLRVKCPIVVSSCGAIQTPSLLMRSGLRDKHKLLGKNLLVHPNAKVLAVFNEDVHAWRGVNQAYQITEFFEEGLLMSANFVPPGFLSIAMPVGGPGIFRTLRDEYNHMVLGGVLIEDTGSGSVSNGPFGLTVPRYNLSVHDFHQAIRGVALLSEVFFAAGAKKCYLPFAGLTELRNVDDIPKIYSANLKPQDLELMTVHLMGTAQMGSDPAFSVVDPHGEMHNVRGLFVADASVFPTSIGVNPQLTVMALATRTAMYIRDHFRSYLP